MPKAVQITSTDPFADTSGNSAATPYVVVSPSGDATGATDSANIQHALDTYPPLGIADIILGGGGTFKISQELQIRAAFPCRLLGQGHNFNGAGGTIIQSVAAMRSPLAVLYKYCGVKGVAFDANSLATYGMFFSNANSGRFVDLLVQNAKLDGYFLDIDPALNDSMTFDGCIALLNGTLYVTAGINAQYANRRVVATGTVTVIAGNATITLAGGQDLTTLGIRKGDLIRTGSGAAGAASTFVGMIDHVTATTIVLQGAGWNLPLAIHAGAGLDYAIGVGDGFHESRASNNNSNKVVNGIYRGNAGCGLRFDGLFGDSVDDPLVDTNNFFAYSIGDADNAGSVNGMTITRFYSESNHPHGDIFMGQVLNLDINGVTWSNRVTGAGGSGTISDGGVIISLLSGKPQNFLLQIAKSGGGVIQHRIVAEINGLFASNYADQVAGASAAYANTPLNLTLGANDFVSGAGLVNGATNILVLNTPGKFGNQGVLKAAAPVEEQSIAGGTVPYRVRPDILTQTINGVSRPRLVLFLTNGMTGAPVGWDTALATNGDYIAVRFDGCIK